MSKGVQAVVELAAAVVVAVVFDDYADAAKLAAMAYSTWRSKRADEKSKAAYNASLRDRYAMTRGTTQARQLVFGRCRVSGPVFFAKSYGTNSQTLALCIALAAHEVDAIEQVYFDDQPVSIDYLGNVTGIRRQESFTISTATATVYLQNKLRTGSVTATARYGTSVVSLTVSSASGNTVSVSGATAGVTGQLDIYYQPDPDPYGPITTTSYTETFTIATGSDTFTLARAPDAGTWSAALVLSSPSANDSAPVSIGSVSTNHVTISGASAYIGRQVNIHYQASTGATRARVRMYTGTATQNADPTLISSLPGVWTSAHKATGVAYLVVELDYSDDAFSTGIPNVSAVVRGMKCFDPRTSTTVWTENPALHARALATHPLGGNLPTSAIDDAAVIDAANACDVSATYTMGATNYVRPLYTAGLAYQCDKRPMDGLTELCEAMGGGWVFADGMLRVSAGAYRSPVLSLDESWLVGDQAVSIQAAVPRSQLVNTVSASFADQYQDFVVVPIPRISPSAYTTADGTTLPQDLTYGAVTFAGQAQYLASCMLRQMRQGLTVVLQCNLKAWRAERFDVISVTLARFGWSNKPFEVIESTWTTDGSISLTLRETSSTIWDMDASFVADDPAPNTSLPVPWGLPVPASLTAASGSTTYLQQSDGSVTPRILVSWAAITDSRILVGGSVEIRYWRASDSANQYQTRLARGSDTSCFLDGVQDGAGYVIMARTVSAVTVSNWTTQINHTVNAKTTAPINVTGAAYTQGGGRVHISWNADSTDRDYKLTEVRIGSTWAGGTLLGQVKGTFIDWTTFTGAGTSTMWIAHQNTSGVYSTTPTSLSVTIDGSVGGIGSSRVNYSLGGLSSSGSATPNTAVAIAGVRFGTDGHIYTRGGGSGSSYVSTSSLWYLDGTPPSGFKIQFIAGAQSGSGTLTASPGAFNSMLTLDSSNYQQVSLSKTNGIASATISYTIYDSGGVIALATGSIYLDVESS